MTFTITNPWLSVDRAHEDNEAYLESVAYLAETAYDEAKDQAKETLIGAKYDIELVSGFMAQTTVGEIDLDFKDILVNHASIQHDDYVIIAEENLWKLVYEVTENYIEKQKELV